MVMFATVSSRFCFFPSLPSSQVGTGAHERRHSPSGLGVCEIVPSSAKYSIDQDNRQIICPTRDGRDWRADSTGGTGKGD